MAEAGGLNPLQHGFESHRGHCADCLARQARPAGIAPRIAPTSSSLGDEKHVPTLLLRHGAWRDPCLIAPLDFARFARIAPRIAPTSSSLGDEKHVPSLLLRHGAWRDPCLIAPLLPEVVTDNMRHAAAAVGSDHFLKKLTAACDTCGRRAAQNITASSKPGRKAGRPTFT
jgi:hypothetical protein